MSTTLTPSAPRANVMAPRLWTGALFILLTAALGALTIWLLGQGFSDDRTLSLWSKILAIRDAPEARLEYLGVVYPHLPAYLLMLLRMLPGLDTPFLPYFLANVMVAWVLTRWARELAPRTPVVVLACALIAVIAHPFTLWTATTSLQRSMGLALFYFLCRQLARLTDEDDSPQVYLRIGAILAILFFADERAIYLIGALVFMLPIIMPRNLIVEKPSAFFLVILAPFALAFGAWAYVNWLFFDDALLFLTSPDSAFSGARADLQFTPWLVEYGGEFVRPVIVAIGIACVSFPAIFLLIRRATRRRIHQRVVVVAVSMPILATGIATYYSALTHPAAMTALLLASSLIGFELLYAQSRGARWLALGLLVLGLAGGWFAFKWHPTPAMNEWLAAIGGHAEPERRAADRALGRYLDEHRGRTLIDDSAGYAAIVARGDARELVLPYSDEFKLALRRSVPGIEQVVIADPTSAAGTRDAIARRFRAAYEGGMPGYELVFSEAPWRVYRRQDAK